MDLDDEIVADPGRSFQAIKVLCVDSQEPPAVSQGLGKEVGGSGCQWRVRVQKRLEASEEWKGIDAKKMYVEQVLRSSQFGIV